MVEQRKPRAVVKTIPGINIQWPWSEYLVSGKKTIETRTYPIPLKHIGVELAIIETPGPKGKKLAGIEKARIIGTIIFESSFQYKSRKDWEKDVKKHLVGSSADDFTWEDRGGEVWGWKVKKVTKLKKNKPAPIKRGIVFASACQV